MKLNLKKLTHFGKFSKKTSLKKKGELINPSRDWIIGLSVATTVFLVGIGITVFDFYSQLYVSPNDSNVSKNSLMYRDSEVKSYSDLYDEKEKEFNELRQSRVYTPPIESDVDESDMDIESEETLVEIDELETLADVLEER